MTDKLPCGEGGCPADAAHAKMREVHDLWHKMAEAYRDPEQFRIFLNAAIQALRNVTFALQANKKALPRFEEWYGQWQKRLSGDELMKWLVEARNIVVKRGDLEKLSTAHATVLDSYLDRAKLVVEVSPLVTTSEIAADLAAKIPEGPDRADAILSVERRWVAKAQPNVELLDVIAYGYAQLARWRCSWMICTSGSG